ncbi:MAG TPA: glycogen/starch synthase, partial [Anaeromyxobacter sp.]|nr:glycogen/starch synthase [Anaeromyxobacter sp.]
MEILFVSSEVAPWSKTGGLGDVGGALPRALAARGHDVTVVSARYRSIDAKAQGFELLPGALRVRGEPASLWVRRGRPEVHLLEHERFFGSRPGIYGEGEREYGDNAERFAFLTRAALAVPAATRKRVRIVHANDWQTALAPYLLRHEHG